MMFDIRKPGAIVGILRDGSRHEKIRKRGFWVSPDRSFLVVPTEIGVEILDPYSDSALLCPIALPQEDTSTDAGINAFDVCQNLASPLSFYGDEWSQLMILGSLNIGGSTKRLIKIGSLAL
jgi:hypothetical protein